MKQCGVLAIVISFFVIPSIARAETFNATSGTGQVWNVPGNWTPASVPNSSTASAFLPSPTGDLSIALGQPITVNLLDILKPISPTVATTSITGPDALTFAGTTPALANHASTAGTGATTIDVPVTLGSALTVTQESEDLLQFTKAISGANNLTLNRNAGSNGFRTIVLGAANSYGGTTTLNGGDNDNKLVVRLMDANSIPSGSTVAANKSVILELAAGNFTRTLGTGAGQFQFDNNGRNGWGAIGADRHIQLNNGTASINWAVVRANQMILGTPNSNATVLFDNGLNFQTSDRIVRVFDGSAAIDAQFTNVLSSNSNVGGLHKHEAGVLSLANANTYTGPTIVEGGMLRLDHASALGGGGALQVGSGATLGIGAKVSAGAYDFARTLGTAAGQIQLSALGGGGNQANAGLAAFNGDRTVMLDGGNTLVWGTNFFLSGQVDATTPNRNLILSAETSGNTLDFKNPIDLNGAIRTVTTRNGSADIDAVLSGVLSGTGGGLIKDNTGTLVVSGDNSYTGGTTIAQGRVLVNNGTGSGTGTGPVALNVGTLGGTGIIAGTVTAAAATHIAPGSTSDPLDIGGLDLKAGASLDFKLGAPGTSDRLNVTIADGLLIEGGGVTLADAGGLGVGTYTLVDYAGTLMGGAAATTFLSTPPTGPAGFSYALSDTGSTIDLVVSPLVVNDADFNDDNVVDAADYVIWRKSSGATGTGTHATGDANGDTNVNSIDFDIWRSHFGNASGSGLAGNGQIPEPTTFSLLAIVAFFALRVRRR